MRLVLTETDAARKYLKGGKHEGCPEKNLYALDPNLRRNLATFNGDGAGDVMCARGVVNEIEQSDLGERAVVVDCIGRGIDTVVCCVDDLRDVRFTEDLRDDHDRVVYGADSPLVERSLVCGRC